MKKLLSLLTLLLLASGLWAQPTANDFWIHGTVTNSTTNVGIPNHKMYIYEPAENSLPGFLDSTYTDASGYYSYVVWSGSVMGPNRNYYVQTLDCQGTANNQHLMNNQGTTDVGIANFSICDNSTACQAGFTTQPQNNNPLGIYFLSSSTAGVGTITGWSWSFGDGTGATNEPNISTFHTYANPGSYVACLTITTSEGCTSTFCDSIYIANPCAGLAGYTVNTSPTSLTATFIGTFDGVVNNQATYSWNYGDNTTGVGGPTNTHTYAAAGTYNACVTVTYNGCSDTYCQQITVGTSSPCDASFSISQNNLLNSVQFTPVYGLGYSHLWTFGDGTSSTNVDPNHVFTSPGTYQICHTIFDNNGCQDTQCQNVTIGSSGCTSSIIINQDPNAPYTYEFSASVTGGTAPYTYTFNFGDGPNETTTTLPLVHTYTTMGSYSVCLYVSDANGCVSSSCDSITVSPTTNCQAYFYGNPVNPNNSADLAIQFTDYSVSGDSLNPILGWTWNFGDGSTSDQQNPMHDYVVEGVYYVCLTVWNNNGCQSTYCDSIVVGSGNPSNNIISGTVYTSNNTVASNAYVFLLRFDYPNSQLVPQDADVTQNGAYLFSAVPNGDYVVKAALTPNDPLYAVRIPTYYTSAFLWNFGDVITINNNSYTGADIHMIEGSNPGGPGFIGGSVDWADTLRAATDFSGATVVLQTIDGNNIGFAIADANGDYSFPNLAYGTYKLYADFPGYTGNPTFVTLTPITDSITGTQVLLGPATITGVEETSAIDNISLYPNPTTDNATLVVEATKTAQLNLTVVNMMGQVVGSQTINAFAGKNIVQLNTDGLAQGVYSLVLRDSKGVAKVQRLIKQ